MILYKYRKDNEFTEQIFINKQIWLATPNTLNDPFECSYNIPLELIQEHIEQSCNLQISGFAMTCAIYSAKGMTPFGFAQRDIEDFWKSINSPLLSTHGRYQLFKEFQKKNGVEFSDHESIFNKFKESLEKVGIFSLSSEIDNQLLWAHYADESRGIAIGFNATDDSKLTDSEHCLKVKYEDNIPNKSDIGFNQNIHIGFDIDKNSHKLHLTNDSQIAFNDSFFQRVVATKPTAWSYEKEWRYIEDVSGLHPLPARICEIVFGLRATETTIKKYTDLATGYDDGIKFFKISKSATRSTLLKSPL